jgi:hypothetical protein
MRIFLLPIAIAASVLTTWPAPGTTGPTVTLLPPRVAVIDSGIAPTPELRNALVAEYDMAASPARPAYHPRYSHGTMVATVLKRAARQPIELISLRIDDPAGCPRGSAPPCQPHAAPIAAAIRKASSLGVAAINILLSLKDDSVITEAVRDAGRQGILVVLAAGNDGRNRPANRAAAIAGYPHAVLVGALGTGGTAWPGTNLPERGPTGYRYAWQPGVSVPTALADGSRVTATGTSLAAPIETARLLDMRANVAAPARAAPQLAPMGRDSKVADLG